MLSFTHPSIHAVKFKKSCIFILTIIFFNNVAIVSNLFTHKIKFQYKITYCSLWNLTCLLHNFDTVGARKLTVFGIRRFEYCSKEEWFCAVTLFWSRVVSTLFYLHCLAKGVFSPVLPDRGYFVPSHFDIIMLFSLFCRSNLFDICVPQTS